MNVLQILPDLNAGGVEQVVVELTEGLVAAGHSVHVLSSGGRLADAVTQLGGVNHFAHVGSKNILSVPWRIAAIRRCIIENEIDLIHVHSRAPAWPSMFAARAENVTFVTTYHGVYNSSNRLKTLYNSVMARGDHVIANSHYTRDHILKTHGTDPAKVTTIVNGVDMARFDPAAIKPDDIKAMRESWGLADGKTALLLPGRITRWKGQLVAVEALAQLPDNYALILMGDSQGRNHFVDEIKTRATEIDVNDRVKLTGHISNVPLALAASDIVISASTDPEAFGKVSIEAQAMGKPVIATAHGGSLETVLDGQTGLLTAPGDASALAKAILKVENGLPSVGAKGRSRIAQDFSKTSFQSQVISVYEVLLAERPASE